MVGKGWFNMQETSKITYDFGKLKRFLTVVRLMMQDIVLTVVKRCFYEFKKYLFLTIPKKVDVINSCVVMNDYLSEEQRKTLPQDQISRLEKKYNYYPLFSIDLEKTK